MQFPLARDDGLIDLHLVGPRSISASLKVCFTSVACTAQLLTRDVAGVRRPRTRSIPFTPGIVLLQGRGLPRHSSRCEGLHQHRRRVHPARDVSGGEPPGSRSRDEHAWSVAWLGQGRTIELAQSSMRASAPVLSTGPSSEASAKLRMLFGPANSRAPASKPSSSLLISHLLLLAPTWHRGRCHATDRLYVSAHDPQVVSPCSPTPCLSGRPRLQLRPRGRRRSGRD